ncbi:MAG: type II toxin-antitoxin system VapC family toxin [Candidatus Methanofastidiosum sp.]|nr:type II toxin-antitoxin system VapC family toxin [Methanofastidiosum sp.]
MFQRLVNFTSGEIFIDSNIFIYSNSHSHPLKEKTKNFLFKLMKMEINGIINGIVLDEIYHKILIMEISEKYNIAPLDVPSYIKNKSEVLQEVNTPRKTIEDIMAFNNLKIANIAPETLQIALSFSSKLLFSDAIHAATCKEYKITNIATNDKDFENLDLFKIWKP